VKKNEVYSLRIVSELKENSPYLKAYEFNISEIKNINEYSRLFIGYLQMNSYILYNYFINHQSYSLSIEPLFILKYHLLETYENFFLIEERHNNKLARFIKDKKITIINIAKIFENSNLQNYEEISDIETLKNHAFAVSMEFRHENTHQKKNHKNGNILSPIYYFDHEGIKFIDYKKNGENLGEDGKLIESLIDNKENIFSLQTDIIYGNLLDYNFFIDKNFDKLKIKVKEIKNKKNKFANYFLNLNNNENNKTRNNSNLIKEDEDENEGRTNIIEKKYIKKMYRDENLKKEGIIMISDEEYTIDDIKDIIDHAKETKSYETLPKFIKELDKELQLKDSK
jgi:hypothetical protein